MGQYYLKRASLGLIKEIRHGFCLRKVSYSSFIHIKEKPDNTVRFLTSRYKKVHGSLTQYAIGLIITTQAKKYIYIYIYICICILTVQRRSRMLSSTCNSFKYPPAQAESSLKEFIVTLLQA